MGVPVTCWGATEHTLAEERLSGCACGCKVYRCAYCRKAFLVHSGAYGCRVEPSVEVSA